MSVLKWQVNSSSNFALFFIVMTHNSSASFRVRNFVLWTKGFHQCPSFDTCKCSGENLPNFSSLFSNYKSVFLQNFHNSSVSWKITPQYFCSSNNKKSSQLKHKFFLLSSARIKICEVPHVSFETTSLFLFNFSMILHCHNT